MAGSNGFDVPSGDTTLRDEASPTPPKSQTPTINPASHQRTYQACIPCRKRKVRCDLGSVDNPHDPPCVRCRREAKECYFSATRRKKKTGSGEGDAADSDDEVLYEIRSGRKRLRPNDGNDEAEDSEERPRTPGGSLGRTKPLRRPQPPKPVQYTEEDEKASTQTVAVLQAAEVHSGHDALKVLYEAAVRGRTGSKTSDQRPSISGISPSSLPPATSPVMDKGGMSSYNTGPMAMYQNDPMWKTPVGRQMMQDGLAEHAPPMDVAAYAQALKAWSRFRFVRAGWFTAKEAVDYVEYFYRHLAPLTPVVLPDFRPYDTHERLLTQESMLTVTILLIASRHAKLEGPGAISRPYSIHHKLWTYLSGMIQRVVWGQEQFGGGFCGAGAEPGSDVNPLSRKGLRTLGTVESLVLLTEWHPRAMHFPPDEADEELMVPDEPAQTPGLDNHDDVPKGIGGQRMDAWLEPCWRSDRMCWMLLGMAMALAFEIGVFDSSDWQRHALAMDGQPLSAEGLQAYDKRRGNVRDILLIYVTQTSGRLGLTSMLPGNYSKPEDSELFKRQLGQHDGIRETVLHFWLRMAALMREGNRRIFANKAFTRDLIKNGDYKAALDDLQGPLHEWRQDFDRCSSIPKYMRHILEIEYEYCRVYLNALALQAVAERCANEQPSQILDNPMDSARSAITTNGVRTDVAISPQTLARWLGGDRKYMLAVGDAARNLLKVTVDGLYPGEYLRHAPVRTYFRIISVAIMLLKSFSLGASESDVLDSLTLMDRTVDALRTCIVDDVHVASRFADLLDTLTQNLKPRLVRIAGDGRSAGRSRRVSNYGTPDPMPTPFSTTAPKVPVAKVQQLQQPPLGGAALSTPQPWVPTYPGTMPSGSLSVHSTGTHSNPLYGISNDTYDLMGNDFSVMPPPSFGLQSPPLSKTGHHPMTSTTGGTTFDPVYGGSSSGNGAVGFANGDDWLTLPLDPLLNMPSGVDVNQTMYGPQLGEQDMLEVLFANNGPVNGGAAFG